MPLRTSAELKTRAMRVFVRTEWTDGGIASKKVINAEVDEHIEGDWSIDG